MKDFLVDIVEGKFFKNGDISTGESDRQEKHLLIMCAKESFKQFPATCVGALDFLESEDEAGLLREVRTQFVADGKTINNIAFEDGKLKIE
jgi:hypothetical protein